MYSSLCLLLLIFRLLKYFYKTDDINNDYSKNLGTITPECACAVVSEGGWLVKINV